MSIHFEPSAGWVVTCDWPNCGKQFVVGAIRPGEEKTKHYQCGSHHGIIPQKDRPEFQLPEDIEIKEDVIVKENE